MTLRSSLMVVAALALVGKAQAECPGYPFHCLITVATDQGLGNEKSFPHFCTLEFTVTSTRSVSDPFSLVPGRRTPRTYVVAVEIIRLWPGRYRGNDQETCELPIRLGPQEFHTGGRLAYGDILRPGSRWLGRAVTEQQVSDWLVEQDSSQGTCECPTCPCEAQPGVPRGDVLWLTENFVLGTDSGDDSGYELVYQAMDEGRCPVETPPCNCDDCSATELGTDNGGTLMALLTFSTLTRRLGGWWRRRRTLES